MRFDADATTRPRVLGADVTPLVDVVFLLIVFFLTTSSLVEVTRARLDLPEQAGQEQTGSDTPGLVVNVGPDGGLIVESRAVTFEALWRMVGSEIDKAGGPNRVDVMVRADRGADLGALNRVAEGLMDLGLDRWRLATRVPPRGAGGGG